MNPRFFQGNRERLASIVGDGVIVLSGNSQLQQAADSAYEFSQESNFWYLTGINEPDWTFIVASEETLLVAPHISETKAIFDGAIEHDAVRQQSGIDRIITENELEGVLKALTDRYKKVAYLGEDPHRDYYDFVLNPGPAKYTALLNDLFSEQQDIRVDIAKLRAIKQDEELEKMREAIAITADTFHLVHDTMASFKTENHIAATFTYEFMLHKDVTHGYTPIVAGGKNALTLHYVENNEALPKNGLVLLDIGAKKDGYSADITRTYSVGEPSAREREVHHAVEAAHKEIISLLGPGVPVKKYHEDVDRIMITALKSLGLYHQESDYRKYFPHAISHGLGVDVHDSLGKPEVFLPGMVLTVEPGIYIPEEGIGVRIEDDILITTDGHENLSASLPTGL